MPLRNRVRTFLLGIGACCALFWGAIEIAGVPAFNLLRQLGWVSIGIAFIIGMAGITGWIIGQFHDKE